MDRKFLMALVGTTAMIGAAMVALPHDADAALITQAGDSFSVDFLLAQGTTDPNGNQNLVQDIIGEVQFDVTYFNIGADTVAIQVTFKNATVDQGNEVGFWKLGFGTDPNATWVYFNQATPAGDTNKFNGAVLGAPNAFPDSAIIDVTGTTGPGANSTLREGLTDTFLLTIGFGSSIANGVNFDPFNAFVQTAFDEIDEDYASSFQFVGNTPPTDVPEPAGLALFGVGLLGLGYAVRRRKQVV